MELAETVKRLSGSSSEIVTIPYDEAYEAGFEDMPRRVPDLSKIKGLLAWSPDVQIEELLTKILTHAEQSRGQPTVSRDRV